MKISAEKAYASSQNISRRSAYLLVAAAVVFVLAAVLFTAVPEESSGDSFAIGEGDTGAFDKQWTSGDCKVDYKVTWVYTNKQFNYHGTLIVSGNGAMADYNAVAGSYYPTTPWLDPANASSPVYCGYEVIIEEGVTHIGAYAFYNMKKDPTIPLPSTLTSIGAHAFEKTGITSIEIPDTVTEIGECAFYGTNYLQSVRIPDNVKVLQKGTFEDSSIRSVDLPGSLTSIGPSAFSKSQLESIDLPEGLEVLEDSVFCVCTNLKTVVIPDSVKEIREYAFQGCESLTDVTFGAGLESIGHSAFQGSGIQCLIPPSTLKSIGPSAFKYCGNLKYAYLPDSITVIETELFCECALKSIIIPDSVTSIGNLAFAYCPLEYLHIPSSVKTIGLGAFADTSLKVIVIPGSVEKIDMMAFQLTPYEFLTIEEGVKDIGALAFAPSSEDEKLFNIPKSATGLGPSSIFAVVSFYDVDRTTELPSTFEDLAGYTYTFTVGFKDSVAYRMDINEPETITYTWMNYDGTVIQTQELPRGADPIYDLDFPENEFGLTFCGWDSITDQYGHEIYMAMYQPGELTHIGGDDGMDDQQFEEESPADPSGGDMLPLAIAAVIAAVGIAAAVVFIRSR